MKNKSILICFGTRPEWLKIKPLIDLMDKSEYCLLFTGQHPDLLKEIHVDYKINIKDIDNRLDDVITACLLQFPNDNFRGVLVQGDTTSALACALAAFNRKLKIYYLESGLRTYDLEHPYPEEAYRQMITRIANINFTPTKISFDNLKAEKVSGLIYIVGNTILDNLVKYGKGIYGKTVLITLHRRENHSQMAEWFIAVNNLAREHRDLRFILPIHPNPNVIKHRHLLTHVNIIPPLQHIELINILKICRLIISDSGGLQEEGSFFNKKVIVCRQKTERPEGLYTNHLYLCPTPEQLNIVFNMLKKDYKVDNICPYGDGKAAEKIKKILDEETL